MFENKKVLVTGGAGFVGTNLILKLLEKGAKIVTIGGIHGRIVEVSDKTFLVEVDSNVKMRIEKSAISAEATKALDQSK